MQIDIFTLFPSMFGGPLQESILKRAQDSGRLTVAVHNIRDYAEDKHHVTDDTPYGGGGGMVMKPDPVFNAVESVLGIKFEVGSSKFEVGTSHFALRTSHFPLPIILLTPQGRPFTQRVAQALAQYDRLGLICGRYEGVDERVREYLATDEISVGDFVLTGGELPAMIVVDAVARLLPGVLGDSNARLDDSHASGLLEYPHYTRPPEFRGWAVPDVLLTGDHARIARWRREQALRRTWQRRPDLLLTAALDEADREFLTHLAEVATS